MTTTKKTKKLRLDNSTHIRSSLQDVDDSDQRYYNLPILYQMAIHGEVGIPGFLRKFDQGYPPRVCVFMCVCVCVCMCVGGFRG